MTHDNPILDQAAMWAVRTADPAFADWDHFTEWLEKDPAHAQAYDRICADVEDAAAALQAAPQPVNDNEAAQRAGNRRWFVYAASMAAAIFAVFAAWLLNDPLYSIETSPGEPRLVALEAGGEVYLAGGTKVTFDRDNPGRVVLDRGQALFTLAHEPGRQFQVDVGKNSLVDIGTVFDVKYARSTMTVAVSDGAVLVNPDRENVKVAKGQYLAFDETRASYDLGTLPVSQVGEWRDGRLTYRDALLPDVAADLARSTGLDFDVAQSAAGVRVSGSLLVEPVRADPGSLGPLLGVTVSKSGGKWIIRAD